MSQTKRQLTDIQEKWLLALESGDYRQGQGYLRTKDDEYCCLGVACEVVGLDWEPSQNGEVLVTDGVAALAPKSVVNDLGLRDNYGGFYKPLCLQSDGELGRDVSELSVRSLVDLNDDLGWDFETIATWIRENPSEVFD